MRNAKVVVVGAGPAGGACALSLARSGADVVLVDKSKYPRVKVCGSGLSPHALNLLSDLGLRERLDPLHINMAGVTAIGPGGGRVHLRGSKGAWVVPRVELDYTIATAAAEHGAEFVQDTKVTELIRDDAGQVRGVKTSAGDFEADIVVCANGSPSRFERDESPRYGIRTIMGWWKGAKLDPPDEGVMIWDRRLDGYYAWAFPEPHDVVNIGLTIPEESSRASGLKTLFSEILDDHFSNALQGADQVGKWMGHPATVTTKVGHIIEERAIWAGEAARLVCPATVEGIAFALESGMLAGQLIAGHDLKRGFSPWEQGVYRARTGLHMLPKFWFGEGFMRLMRSERARTLSSRVVRPDWFAQRATMLLGERQKPLQRV